MLEICLALESHFVQSSELSADSLAKAGKYGKLSTSPVQTVAGSDIIYTPGMLHTPLVQIGTEGAPTLTQGRLRLAHIGARQPADPDSAGRLRASIGVRRLGTNADDRLPLASLGRV
jgi:hypothetical protein